MCPTCGSRIPDESRGVCPVCLLGAGLETGPAAEVFRQYRPIGVLGEGGMGIVYLAEQTAPVRRRLALKVMKQAAGPQLLARFESERQALALMEHPNIAQLYDAGETVDGHPYFAMEYVAGLAITDYCDRNHFGCRERLRLFQQVCQAVQHAHQKGIIHRDLKPSNILVMERDGIPVPKIIDFGVAKAVNLRLTERTLFTEMGMFIGTPEYMSPEQAQSDALDIDSTSDIYSLGVLLYELLVGATPFDSRTLRRAGYDEIRRVIREEEPPRPTARLSRLGETASEVAERRGGDVASLIQTVSGDLDWIAMKAIEKDRGRRYASASEFSADIERYLNDEPVAARPPGMGYKIGKFVRRHRLQVTAAAAVLAAVLAGLIVSTYLMFRMQRERDLALWTEYTATLAAARSDIEEFRSREAIQALERCPQRFRGWEWNYLYALADTSRFSMATGTSSPVGRLGFAGNDSRLVVAHGKIVQIWNLDANLREGSYGPFGEILAMTRDGSRILARPANGDRQSIEVIDPVKGERLSVLTGHEDPVMAAAFSRDGLRAAAATREGDIRVWQVSTGRLIRAIRSRAPIQNQTPVEVVALNSDGSRVVFASLVSALVWDVDTGRRMASLEHSDCAIQALSITTQDRMLSASQAVRLWDIRTGMLVKMWVPRVATCVRTAAASEDGSLIATAGWMGELQLWSADRDRPIASIYGAPSHPPPVALAYSPRGKYLVVMSQNGRIKVWDAPTAGNLVLRWGNPEEVVGIGLSNDGANIIAAFERGVELLDARMGRRVAYAPIPVTALAVHPKTGEVAVAATDRTVSFWTPELRPTGVTAGPFPAPVTALAFDPVRRSIAVGVETGAVEIWNLERGARVSSTGVDYRVNHMAFTPDGKHLAVAVGNPLQPPRSGGALRILDGATGQPTAASSHPQNVARAFSWLAFNPAGTGILTGFSNSGAAVLYDLKARALAEFSEGAGVMATAFTPDGSRALIAHLDGTLEVWDPHNWQLVVKLYGHGALSLYFSPDGLRLYAHLFEDLRTFSTEMFHPRDDVSAAGQK